MAVASVEYARDIYFHLSNIPLLSTAPLYTYILYHLFLVKLNSFIPINYSNLQITKYNYGNAGHKTMRFSIVNAVIAINCVSQVAMDMASADVKEAYK